MNTISLQVEGMKCGGCESLLKSTLEAVKGVNAARPNHILKRIEVDFDASVTSTQKISEVIAGKGYHVTG
ncbi:MAG: heavy-metal-associated domain-containing protein [Methylococcales bacterium]